MSPSAKVSVDTLATPGTKIHTAMSAIVKGETDALKIATKTGVGRTTIQNALEKAKAAGLVDKKHIVKNLYGVKTIPRDKKSDDHQTKSDDHQRDSKQPPTSTQTPSIAELLGLRILATIQQDGGVADGVAGNQKTLADLVGGSVSGVGDGGNDVFRTNLMLTGEPIVRKVVFNPKTLLIYDYFKTKFDYKGDMAQFLNECVDYFCKGKGLEVSVNLKEAVTSW